MGDRWQLADVVSETGVLPASMDADQIRRGDDDDERLRSGPRSGGGERETGAMRIASSSAHGDGVCEIGKKEIWVTVGGGGTELGTQTQHGRRCTEYHTLYFIGRITHAPNSVRIHSFIHFARTDRSRVDTRTLYSSSSAPGRHGLGGREAMNHVHMHNARRSLRLAILDHPVVSRPPQAEKSRKQCAPYGRRSPSCDSGPLLSLIPSSCRMSSRSRA